MPMMGPPMMGHGGPQGPPKPLFPSAAPSTAASSPGMPSAPVGADFKPLTSQSQPTFSNATISAPPTTNNSSNNNNGDSSKSGSNLIATTGAASKIIHPQEDVSLEELMARMPKYQKSVPVKKDVPNMSPRQHTPTQAEV